MRFIDESFQTMPWDEIDSVVFDIGNVLMYFSPHHVLDVLFGEDEPLKAELLHRVFESSHWLDLDRGTATYEQAVERMAQGRADLRPKIELIFARWMELKTPIPEGVAALRRCREKGKRTYVLSNYHQPGFEWLLQKHDFFSLFDGYVVSCYLHLLKPEPEIYRELIERCSLDPARSLFLDDTRVNVEAAMEAGIQGFWVEKPEKMTEFFA